MRACFLAQNICALGYGVAMVQTLPAEEKPQAEACPPAETPCEPPTSPPNRMFAEFRRQPHYS